MPELEIEEKAAQTLYIATQEQGKAYKKLKTIPEKQRFLFQFWREKDKEQGSTAPLVAYKAFSKRVDEANRQFTYLKTPGWKTDFGRIYITLGPAEQITKELHPIDSKPYIKWEYFNRNIKLTSGSHAEFIFLDRQGGGKFMLVNSNMQGEVSEADWFTREAQQTH
jgi:GWxTD domain-containing protein